jgi:hypothetical protein
MRRDEDPNDPDALTPEGGDDAPAGPEGDPGGDDDQEAMEPDLGEAG